MKLCECEGSEFIERLYAVKKFGFSASTCGKVVAENNTGPWVDSYEVMQIVKDAQAEINRLRKEVKDAGSV